MPWRLARLQAASTIVCSLHIKAILSAKLLRSSSDGQWSNHRLHVLSAAAVAAGGAALFMHALLHSLQTCESVETEVRLAKSILVYVILAASSLVCVKMRFPVKKANIFFAGLCPAPRRGSRPGPRLGLCPRPRQGCRPGPAKCSFPDLARFCYTYSDFESVKRQHREFVFCSQCGRWRWRACEARWKRVKSRRAHHLR